MINDIIKKNGDSYPKGLIIKKFNEKIKQQEEIINKLISVACLDCGINYESIHCKKCKTYSIIQEAKELIK